MRLKTLWIIAILLLIGQLIQNYLTIQYFSPIELSIIIIIITLTEKVFISIGIGAIISALISFIPIRKLKYIKKFKMIFPFGITLMFAISIIINCYITHFDYTGELLFNAPKYEYDSIPVPHDLNCSTLHSGKFEDDYYLITREETIQFDYNKFTNRVEIYKVIWLSDCEYYLISKKDTTKVKIMRINKKFYDCYRSSYSILYGDFSPAWCARYRIIKMDDENDTDNENNAKECIDVDGNVYKTVVIGNHEWMAENLKTTKYKDGTAIPNVTNDSNWSILSTGAYAWYDNEVSNGDTYGALYNCFAVETGNLCPNGWHVPTDMEWTELTDYLWANGHADTEGSVLKATYGWHDNGNGTDDYGFTALPGGARGCSGTFATIGTIGYWWSATEYSTNVWFMHYDYDDVNRDDASKCPGFSVRCLRD